MVLFQRQLYFSKDPEGSNIFQGGGGLTFPRGVQIHISLETHINCDFLPPPPPPPSGSAHA